MFPSIFRTKPEAGGQGIGPNDILEIDSRIAEVQEVLQTTQARIKNISGDDGDGRSLMLGVPIAGPAGREVAKLRGSETELKKTLAILTTRKVEILRADAIQKLELADAAHRQSETKVREVEILLGNKRRELEAAIPAMLKDITAAVNAAVTRRAEARSAWNSARGNESRAEDLVQLKDELTRLAEEITHDESALATLGQELRVASVTGNVQNEATLKQRVSDLERRIQQMNARKTEVEQAIECHEITQTRVEHGKWETALREVERLRDTQQSELAASVSGQLEPLRLRLAAAVADRQRAAAELQSARNGVELAAKGKAA